MIATPSRFGSAEVTLPSDTDILIVRRFDAPAARIYEAWTTPELVCRWWVDETMTMNECTIELRVGGSWRYAVAGPDDTEFAWHGTYLEIDPVRRLVSTETFEGYPEAQSTNTLTLSEESGVTTLTVLVHHKSQENRDGHIGSGMEPGLQLALDRVERIVAAAR